MTLTPKETEELREEFDARFTREDGLIDKYAYDDDGDTVAMPEALKDFFFSQINTFLEKRERELVERIEKDYESKHYCGRPFLGDCDCDCLYDYGDIINLIKKGN